MSDQCKYCSGRGDIKKCESAECDRHEIWYAKYLKKELSEKDKRIKELEDGIDHILQMAQGLNADELYDLIEELNKRIGN